MELYFTKWSVFSSLFATFVSIFLLFTLYLTIKKNIKYDFIIIIFINPRIRYFAIQCISPLFYMVYTMVHYKNDYRRDHYNSVSEMEDGIAILRAAGMRAAGMRAAGMRATGCQQYFMLSQKFVINVIFLITPPPRCRLLQ